MTALPTQGVFTNAATTNAVAKQAQDDMLAAMLESIGGSGSADADYERTIAAGSITPTRATHIVDTESDAATDDLDVIAVTNMPDGRFLILRAANDARTVVLKHLAGGTGQISLEDDADFSLDTVQKFIVLQRIGNLWEEVKRGFGTDLAAKLAFILGTAGSADQGPVFDGTSWAIAAPPLPRGHRDGMITSRASATQVDITAGAWRDRANTANLVATAAVGKTINSSWATGGTPGTPTGGLSSSITLGANTWYHVIAGLVAGVFEVGFDTSITGATLITDHSFTNTRRIGAVLTDGGNNIIDYFQIDDHFYWVDTTGLVSSNPGTAAVTQALPVPQGVEVLALLSVQHDDQSVGTSGFSWVSSLDQTDQVPTDNQFTTFLRANGHIGGSDVNDVKVKTNTLRQVRRRLSFSDAAVRIVIATNGWQDPLDRNAA